MIWANKKLLCQLFQGDVSLFCMSFNMPANILDKIGMKLEIRAATSDDGPDDLDLVQAAESLLEDLEAFVRLLRRRSGA